MAVMGEIGLGSRRKRRQLAWRNDALGSGALDGEMERDVWRKQTKNHGN